MPSSRTAIEAFVSGTLDYGGLQAELSRAAESGTPRDVALDDLRRVEEEIGLSTALNNLIARAIDRHFDGGGASHTHTVPGGSGDQTSPGKPKTKTTLKPPPKKAAPAPIDPDAADADDEAPSGEAKSGKAKSGGAKSGGAKSGEARPGVASSGVASSGEADSPAPVEPVAEGDPVADLPPIYAAGVNPGERERPPGFPPAGASLPEPGTVLADRFVLQSVLGRGGMGVVYRALDRRREEAGAGNPFVALKVLRNELHARPAARSRLFAEALQGQYLQHPSIVAVHDFDRDGELAFVTMELLEGERLRTALVRSAPDGLPRHEAFALLRGILEATSYLHENGFVHRDLTPGNIMVASDGKPKLMDFGLAQRPRRGDDPALGSEADPGAHTPAYACPELIDGAPPDPRDDVYALGVLSYEVLTGRHPFDKMAADEARRRKRKPARVPGLNAEQWRTLRSALSFDAAGRPADAGHFLNGMQLVTEARRSLRPGVAQGLLAGVAAGVLLTLAVIHPDGPIGSRLEGDDRPSVAETTAEPGIQAGQVEPAPRTPAPQASPDPADIAPSESALPPPEAAPSPSVIQLATPETARASTEDNDARSGSPTALEPAPRPLGTAEPDTRPGRLQLSATRYAISEGTAVAIAEVLRSDGTGGAVGVHWRTVGRSALNGEDFVGSGWQRLELADGEESGRIFVPLVNDGLAEPAESFFIEIERPDGGATLGDVVRSEVRISDDDTG